MAKILIIDDEEGIRSLCSDFFTAEGHEVLTAATGTLGVELVDKAKPDLVLIDVHIPGEQGLSLLKKLRAKDPQLSVIVFSGNVSAEMEKEAFGNGAIEVIAKGVKAAEIRSKVNQILATKAKVHDKESTKRSEKILIVDDEETVRNLLAKFFEMKGFKTVSAASGPEAIEVVRSQKPTMILLDINMPGMDGLTTLKNIREFDKDVGVVIATGVSDETVAQKASAMGAYHYVLKPFDLKYLELVVLTRLILSS